MGWVAFEVMNEELSRLVMACMDEKGTPRAPDKYALMRARGMLSKGLPGALVK